MASSKPGSSAKIPAISFHHGNCFPLAVPSSALSLANSASKVATLCSRSTKAMGISVLGSELFLILPSRIVRVNSTIKPMQHRHADDKSKVLGLKRSFRCRLRSCCGTICIAVLTRMS
jgi:hypothetical protein